MLTSIDSSFGSPKSSSSRTHRNARVPRLPRYEIDDPHYPPRHAPRSSPPFCSQFHHKQTGRHSGRDTPYAKPPNERNAQSTRGGRGGAAGRSDQSSPNAKLSGRLGSLKHGSSRRQPEGTPPILKQQNMAETQAAKKAQHSKLNEKLNSEEMKQWLKSRLLGDGILNMSVSRAPKSSGRAHGRICRKIRG